MDFYCTVYLSQAPEDLLFAAIPVNPLLSVHGGRRDRGTTFRDGVLAEEAEGFLWCIEGGGFRELGYPVAD